MEQNLPPASPKKLSRELLLLIVFTALSILGITSSIFLFMNGNTLKTKLSKTEAELENVKDAKSQLEKDLIFYKNTDLAKEVELLQLKLENAEKELKSTQSQFASTNTQLKNLQTNTAKLKPYLDVIDAIEKMLSEGPNAGNVAGVDSKVSTLGDSEVSNQWSKAKANIDLQKASWSGSEVSATVTLITSRIRYLTQ